MKSGFWLKAGLLCTLLLFVGTASLTSISVPRPQTVRSTPCAAPEYHQLDFWVGDWDVFDVETKAKDAHVKVDRILDGCVLREQYDGADGHRGQSFSMYDSTRKVWHQSWVTNRGELLMIEGGMQNGSMVLSGEDRKNGRPELVRGEWKAVKSGVRETAATSTDGGKTWTPWFDLMFRPAISGDNTASQQHN
jgi:hypothetical protein